MSRLKEKLVELGYKRIEYCEGTYLYSYRKELYKFVSIEMFLNSNEDKIRMYEIDGYRYFSTRKELNEMKEAYDILEKDLEVLKDYEEKNL